MFVCRRREVGEVQRLLTSTRLLTITGGGDIRALPVAGDSSLDAAFCEKVLIHAGPTSAALGELVRVVRPGGRAGAIEWYPQFALSTTDPSHATALNAMFRTVW
jgi:ubiquinone/menaquinone biosynthesis C-methylase UbiE